MNVFFSSTCVGPQQAVEHCAVLSFIQVGSLHGDHRRAAGLVLKHAGVEYSLRETRLVIVDVENRHQDLSQTKLQSELNVLTSGSWDEYVVDTSLSCMYKIVNMTKPFFVFFTFTTSLSRDRRRKLAMAIIYVCRTSVF